MKFSIIILVLCLCATAFSATLTVDNRIPSAGQYITIQAAHDAAAPGDNIYVYPSPNTYDGITVTKEVHIYGSGWGFAIGTDGICNTKAGSVTFNAGADGSSISGLEIDGCNANVNSIRITNCYITNTVFVNANDITIIENRAHSIYVSTGSTGICVYRNYLYAYYEYVLNYSAYLSVVLIDANCEVSLCNNIIIAPYYPYGTGYQFCLRIDGLSDCLIAHNTIYCILDFIYAVYIDSVSASIVSNNIVYGFVEADQTYWSYNVILRNNNTLFVNVGNGDYHLAPGSPAIGAGENGIDCGAYGGAAPFNDNLNTSELPTVIQLTTPTTIVQPDSPMPITIRARTND